MMPRMRPLIALLMLFGLGLPGMAAADTNLIVAGCWLRQPPPGVDAAAAYLVLANQGRTAVRLTGVSSPLAHSVTLHESMETGGMSRMRPLAHLDLPAGGHIEFKPGGRHIMLQGLARTLAPGDRVPLLLHFADGTQLSAMALVVALNAN